MKAIINTDQPMTIDESENTIIYVPQLNQTLFFMLSTVMEYNYSTLHDLGVLNPSLTYNDSNALLKKNMQTNS